jgi:hypothetical protein
MPHSAKIFFIIFFLISLSLTTASFSLARDLEVTYPVFDGVSAPNSTRTLLPDYVKYIFTFVVAISGLVVFGSMIYAGFRYATSAGNPTTITDAKDRIISAIIGMIVILSSYLLLNTVNPQLVVINPILGTNEGVIVYDTLTNCGIGLNNPESQSTLRPDENYIKFGVSSASLEGLNGSSSAIWLYRPTTDLIVNLYPNENWGGTGVPVNGQPGVCISSPLSTARSIELAWQNPGVYLCKDPQRRDCSIYSSSQSSLAEGFNDQVNYIKLKNLYTYNSNLPQDECSRRGGTYYTQDNQGNSLPQPLCGYDSVKYGAVLHQNVDYGGTCSDVLLNDGQDITPNEGFSSITVFLQAEPWEPLTGRGAILYENTNYNESRAGGEKLLTGAIPFALYGNFTTINWDNKAEDINDKVKSIKIDGNFLTLLFRNINYGGECEVLQGDDPNLDNNSVTAKWPTSGETVSSLKIVPIKK